MSTTCMIVSTMSGWRAHTIFTESAQLAQCAAFPQPERTSQPSPPATSGKLVAAFALAASGLILNRLHKHCQFDRRDSGKIGCQLRADGADVEVGPRCAAREQQSCTSGMRVSNSLWSAMILASSRSTNSAWHSNPESLSDSNSGCKCSQVWRSSNCGRRCRHRDRTDGLGSSSSSREEAAPLGRRAGFLTAFNVFLSPGANPVDSRTCCAACSSPIMVNFSALAALPSGRGRLLFLTRADKACLETFSASEIKSNQSPAKNFWNVSNFFLGTNPPRHGRLNNMRGRRKKSFHPRSCFTSSRWSHSDRISSKDMRTAALNALLKKKGTVFVVCARLSNTVPSSVTARPGALTRLHLSMFMFMF